MSAMARQSISGTLALVLLGFIALFAGAKSLIVLIPAAILVWRGAKPLIRNRNTTRN